MKTFFFLLLTLPVLVVAQKADSLTVAREVDSLVQLDRALTAQQKFEEALAVIQQAESRAENVFGKNSPVYATCVFNHGRTYCYMGRYIECEQLYLEAIGIRERVLGKEHPDYAKSLRNLAKTYSEMDNYEKAEQVFLEAKAIQEKMLGKEHPDYIRSLSDLAILYMHMADYAKSEQLYLETKAVQEKVLGKDDPEYAFTVNNLAGLYWELGDYEKVEPLIREAIAIHERLEGKESLLYASSLENLASLYWQMGDYAKTEPIYLEVRNIREKTLGKEDRDYAMSQYNLGNLYTDMDDYTKAEPLLLEAKAIWGKVLGVEDPDYAMSVDILGKVYSYLGKYGQAEQLYLESNAIREKTLGRQHPAYAAGLGNLATLYTKMGKYEQAKPLYLEAKAIQDSTLGKEHPASAGSRSQLADLYWHTGDLDTAASYLSETGNIEKSLLIKASHFLSEQELSSYNKLFMNGLAQNYSLMQVRKGVGPAFAATCYDNTLFYKGFLLNVSSSVSQLVLTDTAAAEKSGLLKSYRRRLAQQYAVPIAERDSASVAEYEEKANLLEKALVRTTAGYRKALRQVTWAEVQAKLRPGEAALEFVHYHFRDPAPTDSTFYAALVLLPGDKAPRWVPLFEEKQLDSLLETKGSHKTEYANQLYAPGSALYDLVWKALDAQLPGVKTLYFSPSGALHRINFDAISTGAGSMLSDRYQLIRLGSTRQLVLPSGEAVSNRDAALFGGVRYESDNTALLPALSTLAPGDESVVSRGALRFNTLFDSTLRSGSWDYLSFTEREVSSVETILARNRIKPVVRRGLAATEESFKRLGQSGASPRILHVATHGFFFPDPKNTTGNKPVAPAGANPVFQRSDNPMLRAGLLLAGANRAWQGEVQLAGLDDGILTAYEISQMNLSNTELVVLSACETGLGELRGNEGVYGLQRAFKVAGARYVIMSLWQVPDKQTSQLMTSFYRNWLQQKLPIPEAFRLAQKQMRDLGLEPYKWAGFVLVE